MTTERRRFLAAYRRALVLEFPGTYLTGLGALRALRLLDGLPG